MCQQIFQGSQSRAAIVRQETKVTDFDKAFGKDVLEEALHELLDRKSATFDLPRIRLAIFKSDLGLLQAAPVHEVDQAAIAEGDAIDIGSEILERGLPIAHGQAMYHPIERPNFG